MSLGPSDIFKSLWFIGILELFVNGKLDFMFYIKVSFNNDILTLLYVHTFI